MPGQTKHIKQAFCTIITPDYINYALAARKSLLDVGNNVSFHILIAGERDELKEHIGSHYSGTSVYYAPEICTNGTGRDIYNKYYHSDTDAFRWSMKPVFLNYLLKRNCEKVIYIDCDIYFFGDYQFLFDQLDEYSVLITPHWRSPNPHADLSNFETLYTSGLYNGGFIGVNKNATDAMNWWAMACAFICVVDTQKGMFVDQVHLNLLPIYFDKVGILKHKGCNVANWNMVECKRSLASDGKTVVIQNKFPIVFIHFTNSTVRGISSGDDALLMPYLEKYSDTVSSYSLKPGAKTPVAARAGKKNDVSVIPGKIEDKNGQKNNIAESNNFINTTFKKSNADLYLVRKSIFEALQKNLVHFTGHLLDIGCGKMPYKDYIFQNSSITSYTGLDIATALEYSSTVKPDFTWDGITMPFADEQYDTAFGTEVLEHCPQPGIILKEVNRVLKPGGAFFFTVPFLWPLHETPHDEFRYTPFALERILKESGFRDIDLSATGGWHASMAQMLGLWIRRAPMTPGKRNIIAKVLNPIIKKLIKINRYETVEFKSGQMITGLSGIAYK